MWYIAIYEEHPIQRIFTKPIPVGEILNYELCAVGTNKADAVARLRKRLSYRAKAFMNQAKKYRSASKLLVGAE